MTLADAPGINIEEFHCFKISDPKKVRISFQAKTRVSQVRIRMQRRGPKIPRPYRDEEAVGVDIAVLIRRSSEDVYVRVYL